MTPFLSAVLWNTATASLLAVLVGGLGRASWLRRRPAAMHVLWMLVLAKFVTPAMIPVPILPAPTNPVAHSTEDSVAGERAISVVDARRTIEPAESVLSEFAPRPQVAVGIDRWTQLLVALSCLVSALLILRTAIHGIRFHLWLKSVSKHDARLEQLLERGRVQLGCSQLPEVRSLAALCAPFLWAGSRRACIFVPQTVGETLDDEQLTGVLCHELAHHARRDAWSSLFASLVATVCWWNPLVWWARRQLRWTQELCCDAQVLERGGRSRRAYAETLLKTLELVTGGVQLPSALASSWDNGESLQRRFQMIGETSVISRLSMRFSVLALLLAGGLLCLPVHAQIDSKSHLTAVDAQPLDVAPKNEEDRTKRAETTPLYIHFIGNDQDNSTIHLLTRRVGPSGEFEEVIAPSSAVSPLVRDAGPITSSVKELTGRVEQRGEKYFVDLEFHLAMRDGYFQGEVALDKPTFPVFLAASSVIYPVAFIVTRNLDRGVSLNQPFFKQGEEPTAVPAAPATRIVGRITDPAGKPLADMQIVAAVLPPPPKRAPKPGRRMEWKLVGEVPPSATSDEEGRFTIDKADPRATVMLQFHGAELQQPRKWQPKGSLATTISFKVAEKESELEVGYVPRNMTTKVSTVDGRVTREVAITWAPTRIIAMWGYAPTIEKWKESRTLAEARDPRWKDGLLASDETIWVVPPGEYVRDEHNQHIDLGSALQLGTSWGQGLRADSEKEISLFFGALDPRTKQQANP